MLSKESGANIKTHFTSKISKMIINPTNKILYLDFFPIWFWFFFSLFLWAPKQNLKQNNLETQIFP